MHHLPNAVLLPLALVVLCAPLAPQPALVVHAPSAWAGDYFIDPTFGGDSGDGTDPAAPLTDLTRLEELLGTPGYRGGVRFWLKAGTTVEHDGTAIEILAWGEDGHPIEIGSYRSVSLGPGGVVIDACENACTSGGAVIRKDPSSSAGLPIGIELVESHHVVLRGLEITGFLNGLVSRACEHVVIEGCRAYENSERGLFLRDFVRADGTRHATRHVTVRACCIHDNGMDTAGSNLALGLLTGSVTVQGCELYSSIPGRGVDGLLCDGASSGHLIENNVFRDHSSLPGPTLEDGDGIDLKAVYQRNPLDEPETVIRDNVIVDNDGDGIVIHNGCRDLKIVHNRIERNHRGILVLPGRIKFLDDLLPVATNPYDPSEGTELAFVQERFEIACNRICHNVTFGITLETKNGVLCTSDDADCLALPELPRTVYRDFVIEANTIDDNGFCGLFIARRMTPEEAETLRTSNGSARTYGFFRRRFENIRVHGNVLRRNRASLSGTGEFMQMYLWDVVGSTAAGETDLGEFDIEANLFEPHPDQPAGDMTRVAIRRWEYGAGPTGTAFQYNAPAERRLTLSELEALGLHGSPRTLGSASPIGAGCADSSGLVPALRLATLEPLAQKPLALVAENVPPTAIGLLALGFVPTSPVSLALIGADPSCELLVAPDVVITFAPGVGDSATIELGTPPASAIGVMFDAQVIVVDPGAPVGSGPVVSNGLAVGLGGY